MALLPVEHGGYAMLLFPIASALAATGCAVPALALAAACVLAFLSHRAFLVVAGVRRLPELARAATRTLMIAGAAALALACVCFAEAPGSVLWSLLGPAAGGSAFLFLLARRAERTAAGELLASIVLPSCAVPVALAGGAPLATACAIGAVWIAGFATTSLGVRRILERHRPRGVLLACATLTAAGAFQLAFGAAAAAGLIAPAALLAPLPLGGLACHLALRKEPARIGSIGWALVVASAATLALLVSQAAVSSTAAAGARIGTTSAPSSLSVRLTRLSVNASD
jgi:hypothetical protein